MTDLTALRRDLAIVVLCRQRLPRLFRVNKQLLGTTFEFDGERFDEITNDDFFGFYNWLRPDEGKIIGLHLLQDASEDRDLGVSGMMGVETISPPEWEGEKDLKILFGSETESDERLSLDQDFGDNGIFHGSNGSVALLFNAPPDEDVIVLG